MTEYEQKILSAFQDLCKANGDGASPHEVTQEMHRRGHLAEMDTVIDIEDQMKNLRSRGLL